MPQMTTTQLISTLLDPTREFTIIGSDARATGLVKGIRHCAEVHGQFLVTVEEQSGPIPRLHEIRVCCEPACMVD